MEERFPRPIRSDRNKYLIHKVSRAWVDDRGILRFKFEDGSGREHLQGPFYPSLVNGRVPDAEIALAMSGLHSPEEVRFVIAYHSGAFPNGMPERLLRSLEEIPERYLSPNPD